MEDEITMKTLEQAIRESEEALDEVKEVGRLRVGVCPQHGKFSFLDYNSCPVCEEEYVRL